MNILLLLFIKNTLFFSEKRKLMQREREREQKYEVPKERVLPERPESSLPCPKCKMIKNKLREWSELIKNKL
jgi:hypothetical protein